MDERRFRLSIIVIFVAFLFSLARVITGINPLRVVADPLVSRLDEYSSSISVFKDQDVQPAADSRANEIDSLKADNDKLREQLKLADKSDFVVTAEVSRRDMFSYEKTLWVGAGKSAGVEVGDAVTVNGVLVGVVRESYDKTAAIKLLTDPSFRATVVVDGDKHGILKTSHGSVIVDLLPSKALSGKIIETDGLGGLLPPGIALGVLGDETGLESDVFGRYSLSVPYNAIDLEYVQIMTEGEE